MNHWWRAYNEAVNDPKLQLISDALFRAWFNLMCIASGNDGALPPLATLAFTLRMKTEKVAQVLTQLHKAGLLDKTETGFVPHNWNGRQYKTDKVDETAAERMARYRERKRNERNAAVTDTVTRVQTTEIDRIGSAGASAFSEGSKALATTFWKALGWNSLLEIPPEFAGIDWRALEWERAGWTADLIDAEARKNGSAKPISYHEKCFATAFAKRQAPLPIVEIKQADKLTVTHGSKQNNSVSAIARRFAEQFENQSSGGVESNPDAFLSLPQG